MIVAIIVVSLVFDYKWTQFNAFRLGSVRLNSTRSINNSFSKVLIRNAFNAIRQLVEIQFLFSIGAFALLPASNGLCINSPLPYYLCPGRNSNFNKAAMLCIGRLELINVCFFDFIIYFIHWNTGEEYSVFSRTLFIIAQCEIPIKLTTNSTPSQSDCAVQAKLSRMKQKKTMFNSCRTIVISKTNRQHNNRHNRVSEMKQRISSFVMCVVFVPSTINTVDYNENNDYTKMTMTQCNASIFQIQPIEITFNRSSQIPKDDL